ncbi:Protein SDA1 [Colletotrichum sp. SAR 10_77]|nr:Protein SDA1 [Colletotrichum sp. SAR 10_77]
MASDGGRVDVAEPYQAYKTATNYVLQWLWIEYRLRAPEAAKTNKFKSTKDILRAAKILAATAASVPSTVIHSLHNAINKRQEVLKIYQNLGSDDAAHEAFLHRLKETLNVLEPLVPKPSTPREGTPELDSSVATNRFSALGIQEPTESSPIDTFLPETQKKHSETPDDKSATSASEDGDIILEDDSIMIRYKAMCEAIAFIRKDLYKLRLRLDNYWTDVAEGKMTFTLASWLTSAAVSHIQSFAPSTWPSSMKYLIDNTELASEIYSKTKTMEEVTASTIVSEIHYLSHLMVLVWNQGDHAPKLPSPTIYFDELSGAQVDISTFTTLKEHLTGPKNISMQALWTRIPEMNPEHVMTPKNQELVRNSMIRHSTCEPLIIPALQLIRNGELVNASTLYAGIQILVSSSKAFFWPRGAKQKEWNCGLRPLRLAMDMKKKLVPVTQVIKRFVNHRTAVPDQLKQAEDLHRALVEYTKGMRWDLYHQAPWTAGCHLNELLVGATIFGQTLYDGYPVIPAVLHLYNVLCMSDVELTKIKVLEGLCEFFKNSAFNGKRPKANFLTHSRCSLYYDWKKPVQFADQLIRRPYLHEPMYLTQHLSDHILNYETVARLHNINAKRPFNDAEEAKLLSLCKATMGKRKVTALEKVDVDFASLQYKIRRDPRSYEENFLQQWGQYESQREVFLTSPTTATREYTESFHNLVDLIAHTADLYPKHAAAFPDDLKAILLQHHEVLHPELREKIVGSLALLRKKEVIDSTSLLTSLFPILVSSPSKTLRTLLFQKILSEMRNANSKGTNHPLNRTIQTVLYNLITADRTSPKALWAVKLTRELWKRQIWTDAKTVDVMKEACLSDNEKVVVGATRFFLGGDKEREEMEDEDSDEEQIDLQKMKHQIGINKKSKKQQNAYKKAVSKLHKQERSKSKPHPLNFSAFHLLHDPQGFAENVFQKHLQNTKVKFSQENRILVLQLVTRLVGLHKLTIISLYSWFIKFLTPRQESVTSYLACLAQGTHNLVPPDAVEPLIQKIANEFVSEASASEVAAAGLNAIREICVRQPLAMSDTLLQDLVQYRKSKDKGVMMAAKGLLSLYREVGAELLMKKDRGKDATMGLRSGEMKQRKFGEEEVGGIEGIELLAKWKEEQRKLRREAKGLPADGSDKDDEEDDGFNSDDWEVDSVDSDDSGGWIAVDHSSDEEEEPVPKKRKTGEEGSDDEDEVDDEDDAAEIERIQKLATTTILTPADLAKLQELRLEAGLNKTLGNRTSKRSKEIEKALARHLDDGLTAEQIEAPAKLRKTTKEERVAMAREGKPDREEHKSTKAIRKSKKDAEGKSTTNKEKARQKNFLMTLSKAKHKNKRSLVQTRKVLQGHITRSKAGGRRRNGM